MFYYYLKLFNRDIVTLKMLSTAVAKTNAKSSFSFPMHGSQYKFIHVCDCGMSSVRIYNIVVLDTI